jgi:hypothetical protein
VVRNNKIIELMATYGRIKVVLVGIFYVVMCGFLFVTLGSFANNWLSGVAMICEEHLPHISTCKNITDLTILGAEAVITFYSTRSLSLYLLKRSALEITIVIIFLSLLMKLGNLILQINYNVKKYQTTK